MCSDPEQVYEVAVRGMNDFPLAYLLLTEPRGRFLTRRAEHDPGFSQEILNHGYRKIYKGTLMAAGGFTPSNAAQANGTNR